MESQELLEGGAFVGAWSSICGKGEKAEWGTCAGVVEVLGAHGRCSLLHM